MLKPILLVEDDPNDLELMLMAIERTGVVHAVDVARDGVECLDYLHARADFEGRMTGNPSLIVLDQTLPRLDGAEVLTQIRGIETLKLIPVVMLTSSLKDAVVERAYELGANACVVKPVDFLSFLQVIGELVKFWTQLNHLPENSHPQASS